MKNKIVLYLLVSANIFQISLNMEKLLKLLVIFDLFANILLLSEACMKQFENSCQFNNSYSLHGLKIHLHTCLNFLSQIRVARKKFILAGLS